MFIRQRKSGPRVYLQVVANNRVDGKVKQTVYGTLGRLDRLQKDGKIEGIIESLARFSKKSAVISEHKKGQLKEVSTLKIGAPLLFGRLWERLNLKQAINEHLKDRNFEFPVERAIFATTLHGIMDPGSDRAASIWCQEYRIKDTDKLDLQHFYRAMAWLGEELSQKEQEDATPFAPRCIKDSIEETLFGYHRDLFTELSVVFFDTTSVYFEGEGGETIGQYGKSKDKRPDLKQMVVGVVLDSDGQPICSETWPGNTTDVKTLLPIVKRLINRFGIRKVCVVADRGMISKETMKTLEDEIETEYILGVRMRKLKEVRAEVLTRGGRFKEVYPGRGKTKDPAPLKVKEVRVNDRRYIVCVNEEQKRKDRRDRETILKSLEYALKQGDKSLVGNKGFRKYLKSPEKGHGFAIDTEKIAGEKKYDGKWVLTTTTNLSAEETALKYKQLWMVENAFRGLKDTLRTRPVYHKTDETIRGHVFCRFLGLVLLKRLQDNIQKNNINLEWEYFKHDLERLEEVKVVKDGKQFILRSETKGDVGKVFQAAGVGLPPAVRFVDDKG